MARSSSASVTPSDTATSASCDGLKFETALGQLEQIVQGMEGGRLPLEESLEAYRRGTELLKYCQQQLSDAERKIQILENGSLRDFEPGTGETR